ncbi:unnamed protein product [Rotaria sp. Silwood1]|nr:unnamed protein product [Rotaria sp. Silwood1]CAF4990655.1 unnamed protein product [Rotaria sp. Silwood1]CAF4995237.1 unnamed protein product [Rotaria sp. Silwood1]CAF5087801.1 unnamed protein product [Rotaria sp. Silwood1]
MRRVQIDNQSINSVALIAIIVAPTTQLRLDEEGKVKIDALCGLAFNLVTNISLIPDHHMDIDFYLQISTEDLIRLFFILF